MSSSSPLTIHHLQISASERVIWLCEELQIPYVLKNYTRDPTTKAAPESYRALHPTSTAPVIQDGALTLGETNAIFEYILKKYGNGRLELSPNHPRYADYLFWLHHINGSLQPALNSAMFAQPDDPFAGMMKTRYEKTLVAMEAQLSKYEFIAGDEFTAVDCMILFPLTTFRCFVPFSLEDYPNVVGYLQRMGKREAFLIAAEKGDPGLQRPFGAAGAV